VAAEKLNLDLVWRGCDIDPQFAGPEGLIRKAESQDLADVPEEVSGDPASRPQPR
jgi:hypothetical protein